MRARRLAIAAALAVVAFGLSACGIPLSSGPQVGPKSEIPQGLLVNNRPPSTQRNEKTTSVYIYLIDDISGDFIAVPRPVPTPRTRTGLIQEVLNSLEAGPLSGDYRDGYLSALPPDSDLTAVGAIAERTATVRLDDAFTELSGESPVDELGQVVWSLTESLGIECVRFLGPLGPIPVEIAKGAFVTRSVGQQDYELVPNPPTSTKSVCPVRP